MRDPGNRFSPNAVEIRIESGQQIGYVPETDAVELAPLLDAKHLYEASIKKVLGGGRRRIPVVVAGVSSPSASRPGLRRVTEIGPQSLAANPSGAVPSARRVGCASVILVPALIVFLWIAATIAWSCAIADSSGTGHGLPERRSECAWGDGRRGQTVDSDGASGRGRTADLLITKREEPS